MPLWDYKCDSCNKTVEKFFNRFIESPNCEDCGTPMIYEPSYYYSSNAQRFDPVVIHRDSEGNIRFPGSVNSPVPEGFQRIELSTLSEVRRFEREINSSERGKIEKADYNRQRNMDLVVAANREDVRGVVEKFSPRGRKFYDLMREAADARRAEIRSRGTKGPEFHLEAFSFDSSNRDAYRDSQNEWGRAGNRK